MLEMDLLNMTFDRPFPPDFPPFQISRAQLSGTLSKFGGSALRGRPHQQVKVKHLVGLLSLTS